MKLEPKVKKFQEGGAAPAPAAEPMPAEQGAAPEQGGGGDEQLMQLAQMAAEALQSGDCNTALLCVKDSWDLSNKHLKDKAEKQLLKVNQSTEEVEP